MSLNAVLHSSGLPRADAEILLAAACGKDRAWLLGHGDDPLEGGARERWEEWCARRAGGEPVAYILGEKEFYGRNFAVDPRVLIPRPATEGLVEAALRFLDAPRYAVTPIDSGIVALAVPLRAGQAEAIADLGTGSGCIAVTLKLLRPELAAYASDVSADALELARKNAARHGAEIAFREGEGMAPFTDIHAPFVLVSNPPYIPDATPLDRDVAEFEPHGALFAGPDGMDVLRPLARAAMAHPHCRGFIVECRKEQADVLTGLTGHPSDR